jgi:hypothetical protein
VGKAGLIGVHTIVRYWTKADGYGPAKRKASAGLSHADWSADKSFESASAPFKFDFKGIGASRRS